MLTESDGHRVVAALSLLRLFAWEVLPAKGVHFADKPVQLRHHGKSVTDHDAVALSRETGTPTPLSTGCTGGTFFSPPNGIDLSNTIG